MILTYEIKSAYTVKNTGSVYANRVPPNEPLGWFANIGTDFGAFLPQIRFLYTPISVHISTNHPKSSFVGTGSRSYIKYSP